METREGTVVTTDSSTWAWVIAWMWAFLAFGLVWFVLAIIGYWRMFTKADEAGWKSIIPIWSTIVWLRIIGRPWWWLLLFLIPVVNVVILAICLLDTAKSYGHGFGFAVGLFLLMPLFLIVLGWGSSTYIGPRGVRTAPPGASGAGVATAMDARAAQSNPLPPMPPMPEMPPLPEMPEPAIPKPGPTPPADTPREPGAS
jgi:hypothetical protein